MDLKENGTRRTKSRPANAKRNDRGSVKQKTANANSREDGPVKPKKKAEQAIIYHSTCSFCSHTCSCIGGDAA